MNREVYLKVLREKAILNSNLYLSFCKENQEMSSSDLADIEDRIVDYKNKVELCTDVGDLLFGSLLIDNLISLTKDLEQ